MSRIHKALERAADGSSGIAESQPNNVADVFVPWSISEPGSAETRDAGQSEPSVQPERLERQKAKVSENPVGDTREKLVIAPAVDPRCVEQYRRLSAALHLTQAERGIKVIMVASALPGEGKTLTAVNVALTLSESYRRSVLLVDADLRRPAIHDVFRVPNQSGLNEGLKSASDRKLVVTQFAERLAILPSGIPDPDPMGGLSSERMRRVLSEAASTFDWVILDTPPLELLPDAHLLAAMVDGVVLVVRAGKTPSLPIQRAIQALGRERIVGVVLNQVADSARSNAEYARYVEEDIEVAGRLLGRVT